MKIQSIEDLQKSNRPVLTKPTPEKKDSQSIQKAVEQTVIAATASRAAVDKVSIVVEDNMRLTSSLVEQLEAVINSNREINKSKPVRLIVNRGKDKLIQSIDVLPLTPKK